MTHKEIIQHLRENIAKGQEWVIDNMIVLHEAGSHLYGTNHKDSDLDIRGITIAPLNHWIGLQNFDQFQYKNEDLGIDVVIYDIRKWIKLCYAMNPNIAETLFVPKNSKCIMYSTEAWDILQETRESFVNQRAYDAFMGFTTAQWKKIQTKQDNKSGRLSLTDKYGFDVKFAMHAIRLARQGCELLSTGKITFPRPDKDYLLKIRFGEVYKHGDVTSCLLDIENEITKLRKIKEKTTLPKNGDYEKIEKLQMDMFKKYVYERAG